MKKVLLSALMALIVSNLAVSPALAHHRPGHDKSTPAPADADSDGVTDSSDNCMSTPNADQADSDSDGTGDACDATPFPPSDRDSDGVDDASDNCPNTYNADQLDSDGDRAGDSCDSDAPVYTVEQLYEDIDCDYGSPECFGPVHNPIPCDGPFSPGTYPCTY